MCVVHMAHVNIALLMLINSAAITSTCFALHDFLHNIILVFPIFND